MKNLKLKLSTVVLLSLGLLSFFTVVQAAELFPDQIKQFLGILGPSGICASMWAQSRIQFVIVLVLGGIVLVAVGYALYAAFKYIRSEGDSAKMEEAQKSIKAIFIGIAAMIVAIIGIVLVFAVFGSAPTNPELFQTCINAPNSEACSDCRKNGASGEQCRTCEAAILKFCQSPDATDTANQNLTWDKLKGKLDFGSCD